MRKETRKEFVVCKDVTLWDINFNKGDIVQMFPLEFFDSCEPDYRDFVDDCGIPQDRAIDVCFITPENFQRQFTDGTFDIKFNIPIDICELPYLFNELKIQPRNVTVEFDN